MSDSSLLYIGMFCFAMTLCGLVLTVLEVGKVRRSSDKSESATD